MLSRWLPDWPKWRARNDRPAAAVYFSPRSVAVAMGSRKGDRYVLDLRADPISQISDAADRLRDQSRDVGLANTTCNLVLAPELYTVSLVERPQVPDEELKEAVRWRMQDNLEFPVDQAAIDVFPLPESASRDRSMVFVVALHMETLKRLLDKVYAAGIQVGSVDVSELALRNIAHGLYPEPAWSVGLLRLTAGSGVINISRGDELFLSRRVSGIPAELSESAWEKFNDRLLLQVQRSIDYYESAMGQPPCNALIVATTQGWQDKVCDYLSEMLPVSVRSIKDELRNLCDIRLHNPQPVDVDWDAPTIDQRNAITAALPAVGGLMRAILEQSEARKSRQVKAAA
jgi:MSHA biogenesis protein MshI